MVLVTLISLTGIGSSQEQTSTSQTKTFTAPDHAFQFSYSSDFSICTAGKMGPCSEGFIPVCEDVALVCVTYPADSLKDTNVGGVSFQVIEIRRDEAMITPDICASPYPVQGSTGPENWPDFLISAKHPVEMIGRVQFIHGVTGDAATSHSLGVNLYRAYHKQRCFELRVSTSATNPAAFDPPMKTLTPAQEKKLDHSMSEVLHSFRFAN